MPRIFNDKSDIVFGREFDGLGDLVGRFNSDTVNRKISLLARDGSIRIDIAGFIQRGVHLPINLLQRTYRQINKRSVYQSDPISKKSWCIARWLLDKRPRRK